MQLEPWSHPCSAGFTLRGYASPPSGRPVLHFLHGNGFCGRTYDPMLVLLARDFDLFLSDMQGHGESEHGGRFVGWERSSELVAEVWRAQAARYSGVPVFAVGHSFGAVITALTLAREPELFTRAVLLDPVFFTPAMALSQRLLATFGLYQRNALARQARARRAQWPSGEAAADYLRHRGMFRGWDEAALQAYVRHALATHPQGVALRCRPEREAEIFGSYARRLWPALKQIAVPTLLLYGQRSYPFVAPSARRLARRNPRVEIAEVAGGHCFMQEDPKRAAAAVTAWLA